MSEDLRDIRATLWRILADLGDGELDPEVAEQQISALDSLIDIAFEARDEGAEDGKRRGASADEGPEQHTRRGPRRGS